MRYRLAIGRACHAFCARGTQSPAPLGRYMVDFVAPRAKLIVEVDGSFHRVKQSADARRDRKLARLGYRVLRLEADLVLRRLPLALQRIREGLFGE